MVTSPNNSSRLPSIDQLLLRWTQLLDSPAFKSRDSLTRMSLLGLAVATSTSIGTFSIMAMEHLRTSGANDAEQSSAATPTLAIERLRSSKLFADVGQEKPSKLPELIIPSRSSWDLQGAFTGAAATSGSAILSDGKGPARLVHTSQQLPGGATLVEVHNDRVILQQQDGNLQVVRFPLPSEITLTDQIADSGGNHKPPFSGAALSEPATEPVDNTEKRRAIVRQRLETLRQRALSSS
jgi:hypothetical protein